MSDAEYGSGREDYGGYSPAKRSSSRSRSHSYHSRSASRSKSPPHSRSRSLSSRSRSPSPLPRRKHRSRRSSSRSLSRSRSRSYTPPPKRRYYRSYSRSRSRSRSRGRGRSRSYSPPPRRYHGGRSGGGYRRDHSRSPLSNRRRHTGDRYNPDPSKVLGVFGLSLYTGERDLREMFGKYGPIKEVQVVYDHQTGRSRGFAFVYFEDVDDSVDAKEHCNGLEIDGRRIRVDYSITKRAHTPTPGVYMGKPTRPGGDRDDSRERDRDRDRYYDDDDYYEKPRYSSGGRRSYYY